MKKKEKEIEFDFENMGWAFATINNKLAEFYFDKKKSASISAHCYVKIEEYKTKIAPSQINSYYHARQFRLQHS